MQDAERAIIKERRVGIPYPLVLSINVLVIIWVKEQGKRPRPSDQVEFHGRLLP
jgi:hypothetical protein